MDAWGVGIFLVGTIAYFLSKRKPGWLWISGLGAGILVGAIWAMTVVNRAFQNIFP